MAVANALIKVLVLVLVTNNEYETKSYKKLDSYSLHTFIHNWSLQPFSQDYWPNFSHHLCCVC